MKSKGHYFRFTLGILPESQVADPVAKRSSEATAVNRANVVLLRVDVHVLRVARRLVVLQHLGELDKDREGDNEI